MKTLYFDCFAGISGDMTLGALIDAGLDFEALKSELKKLQISGYSIDVRKEQRNNINGTKFDVKVFDSQKQPSRHLSSILELIENSKISERAKHDACGIFKIIGKAEAKIHDVPIEKVHFHEIGAVDSIIDITGTAIAVDLLGIESMSSAPVPLGRGFVEMSHGRLPVPVPAVTEILKDINVYTSNHDGEIVTPTGAGILKYYCSDFSGKISMKLDAVGYGLGTRVNKFLPGILRVFIGEKDSRYLESTMEVIETNIDDMNPMFYDPVIEKLFAAGALDAYITTLHMKKNRPGCLLTVLADKPAVSKIVDTIFSETTTLGLRIYTVEKKCLQRDIIEVKTKYGNIRVKSACIEGKQIKFSPEFEDCRNISRSKNIPVNVIYNEAIKKATDES